MAPRPQSEAIVVDRRGSRRYLEGFGRAARAPDSAQRGVHLETISVSP